MIQSVKPAPTDETDGLPMPKRIWAVISVGFALCMSVLDINIVNIVLPTLSHDFGTSPAVTTWIINGYQLAIVISLLSFSALGEIIGYRKVFLSTRVRDNILKSKEQKNIQPTKGGHKMVTCQNYVSLFYRQITSCPSDGGIS